MAKGKNMILDFSTANQKCLLNPPATELIFCSTYEWPKVKNTILDFFYRQSKMVARPPLATELIFRSTYEWPKVKNTILDFFYRQSKMVARPPLATELIFPSTSPYHYALVLLSDSKTECAHF